MTNKIIQARIKFKFASTKIALLDQLEQLFKAEFQFSRTDPVSNLSYFDGEKLGIRFVLETNPENNIYFFSAISANDSISFPFEVIDISFHFKNLLSNIIGLEFISID